MLEMAKSNVISVQEVEEAKLNVLIGGIKIKAAEQEQKEKTKEMEKIASQIKFMHLESPLDGIVQRVDTGVGERVDPNKPVLVIVQNDKLKVKVNIPARQAAKLSPQEKVKVKYPDEKEWVDASIIYFDPVVDAASGLREVQLEIANAANRPAGLEVSVQLPEKARNDTAGAEGGPAAGARAAGARAGVDDVKAAVSR
jgi:multidrug resistance efflux pump